MTTEEEKIEKMSDELRKELLGLGIFCLVGAGLTKVVSMSCGISDEAAPGMLLLIAAGAGSISLFWSFCSKTLRLPKSGDTIWENSRWFGDGI